MTNTMDQPAEMVRELTSNQFCTVCRGAFLILCPAHRVNVDSDGWCIICDTGSKAPGEISCSCQDF